MGESYSKTYSTGRGKFRYNYTTGKLERIGNKVHVVTLNQRQTPIVETDVTDCINLNPLRFNLCPEYWIELYESVLERIVKK